MKKALYPLSKYIASFDFFHWLVRVKALGYTEVVFDITKPKTGKWPLPVVMQRFESILKPGCDLAGMPWSIGTEGDDVIDPHMIQLIRFLRAGNQIEPLISSRGRGAARYTVTIRRTQRSAERNSDEMIWLPFAVEIGAVVIEDYDVKPLDLRDRVALYAGADLNFFVANGPAFLCSLTPYPVAIFGMNDVADALRENGIPKGSPELPWRFGEQNLIWSRPDGHALRKWFYDWREQTEARAVLDIA